MVSLHEILLVLLTALVTELGGTTGTITGKVTRKDNDRPICNAIISIEGLKVTSATDSNGIYSIKDLPPGRKSLIVTAIGYCTFKRLNVAVIPDYVTIANIQMGLDTCKTLIIDANERPLIGN